MHWQLQPRWAAIVAKATQVSPRLCLHKPRDEQRPQCFGPSPEAEFRPDIPTGDYPPRDKAECDAHEKPDHLLWHDECLLFKIPAIDMTNASLRRLAAFARGCPGTGLDAHARAASIP